MPLKALVLFIGVPLKALVLFIGVPLKALVLFIGVPLKALVFCFHNRFVVVLEGRPPSKIILGKPEEWRSTIKCIIS